MSVVKVNFNLSPPAVTFFESNPSSFSSVSRRFRSIMLDYSPSYNFIVIISSGSDMLVLKPGVSLKLVNLSFFYELVKDISRFSVVMAALRSNHCIESHFSPQRKPGSELT